MCLSSFILHCNTNSTTTQSHMAASLSPLPRTTSSSTSKTITTTTTITTYPTFLHNNATKFSFTRKRNHGITSHKISCSGDQNHNTSSSKNNGQPSIGKLDRRDILVGLGGLYGVAGLSAANDLIALANPVLFHDENAQSFVSVKVKDCLNNIDLRYKYQEVSSIDPWLNARPTPLKKANKVALLNSALKKRTELSEYPVTLNRVIQTEVPRPKKSRSKSEKTEEEEVLVIDGIELESELFVKFDVLVNDEDGVARPDNTEFAGSFVNVPHKHKRERMNKTSLRLGLTALLEDLEADDDDTVLVTLVPRSGSEDVTVGGIKIELSS